MQINRKQAEALAASLYKTQEQRDAVVAYVMDEMSAYAAEKHFGRKENTVARDSRKLKSMWALFEKVQLLAK